MSHLHEFDPAQRLGEDVYTLTIGANMRNIDLAFFDALTDVVELRVNVFAPIVMHRVLAQRDR